MIVLDTQVWIWWVHNDPLLPQDVTYSNLGMGMRIVIAERVECGESSPL